MFPDAIETDRLRFERLSRDAVDPLELYEYTSRRSETIDVEVAYVTWDPHETPKETLEMLERAENKWDGREGATYAIFQRAGEDGADEFVGTTSLFFEWDKRLAYTGIWLRKPFWGRGYAGERAAALFSLAFDRLDLEVVVPTHLDGNEKSKRAIEKYVDRFGGRYEGRLRNEIIVDGEPRGLHRYSVSREEWVENRPNDLEITFIDGDAVGTTDPESQ